MCESAMASAASSERKPSIAAASQMPIDSSSSLLSSAPPAFIFRATTTGSRRETARGRCTTDGRSRRRARWTACAMEMVDRSGELSEESRPRSAAWSSLVSLPSIGNSGTH